MVEQPVVLDGTEAKVIKPAPKKNAGKEKARQRNRAISLISKYAGTYSKEAQKTKWVVELVTKIDEEYKQELLGRKESIDSLQQQLRDLEENSSKALQEVQQQARALQLKVQEQELEIYNTSYALQAAQAQHAAMQESLRYAEEAAAVATSECATLAATVQAMTEQDAKARCGLAHRAHHLRDALLQTSAALRQFNDSDRKERSQKEIRLGEQERALAAGRAALLEQQAAHQQRDAALENLQLKYHLAAMKIRELRTTAYTAPSNAAAAAAGASDTAGAAAGMCATSAAAGGDQAHRIRVSSGKALAGESESSKAREKLPIRPVQQ